MPCNFVPAGVVQDEMENDELLRVTDRGLYCEEGDFFIDPWLPVDRAVLTHAHGDHARQGSNRYLAASPAERILRLRLGPDANLETVGYGQALTLGSVRVSMHPAGHILGSAQIRMEHRGQVWVVSGDYKLTADPTCAAFEPIRCHTFLTESTFGLPIYRWPDASALDADINGWWRQSRDAGQAALLYAYSLGKSQRILAKLEPDIGPIYTHGAVEILTQAYRESGVRLPPTQHVSAAQVSKGGWAGAMILAPPNAQATPWTRRFGAASTAFASGWMRIRGTRRRRAIDRGFVLSDHADWPELLRAIESTGAERVLVTHGYTDPLVRWLREHGKDAHAIATHFEGEHDEVSTDTQSEGAAEAQFPLEAERVDEPDDAEAARADTPDDAQAKQAGDAEAEQADEPDDGETEAKHAEADQADEPEYAQDDQPVDAESELSGDAGSPQPTKTPPPRRLPKDPP